MKNEAKATQSKRTDSISQRSTRKAVPVEAYIKRVIAKNWFIQ